MDKSFPKTWIAGLAHLYLGGLDLVHPFQDVLDLVLPSLDVLGLVLPCSDVLDLVLLAPCQDSDLPCLDVMRVP